ncbi:tetraacyldisaccharide 4'-kinase [Dissulfurimicrobium hydrothermale]|uniref:tetraacyldisaccharide 4'-kinase n=1 Tax=Dissulfurimicrobium hydrothermale TaxID=1750598 RepID=UPI001EDBD2FC|nr:tetraacyldisaccharide 4'-kinase [Dissulfurimicrobium hydrothermale]UKL13943.1 tetraacyldisaccharide 4'-kinase [Dissulfurimicrobium hydrothermale]
MNPRLLPLLFLLGRPFSPLYSGVMRLRPWAYRKGYLETKALPRPVISIGNITLGGTGKTPLVMAVAEWFKRQGLRVAVVTRGYGGSIGKGPVLVSKGEGAVISPHKAGDEPVMMAERMYGIPVVAGSDRFNAGLFAIQELDAQIILLDDGFQHLALKRDIDILLLSARRLFGTGKVFPGGDLREPLSAISRAAAIVITDSQIFGPDQIEACRQMLDVLAPERPVFFSQTKTKAIRDLNPSTPVFAFCGIGSPEAFFEMCAETWTEIRGKKAFRDHHVYTLRDINEIATEALKAGASCVVTTAKDAVKVTGIWSKATAREGKILPLMVFEIEAAPEPELFDFIKSQLPPLTEVGASYFTG